MLHYILCLYELMSHENTGGVKNREMMQSGRDMIHV